MAPSYLQQLGGHLDPKDEAARPNEAGKQERVASGAAARSSAVSPSRHGGIGDPPP